MGKTTIAWTDYTLNPWVGCTKVSPGCKNCYAEELMSTRFGHVVWGPKGARKRTSLANWRKPLTWDRQAAAAGERRLVFCASLADIFDDHPSIQLQWRRDLFDLIEQTPNLTWQLLTKRPENVRDVCYDAGRPEWYDDGFPNNVWVGTSCENQAAADERIPQLLKIKTPVRFLSLEPLLGPVDLISPFLLPVADRSAMAAPIDWVIVGGESGPHARILNIQWILDVVIECNAFRVPVFVKQLGARPIHPAGGVPYDRLGYADHVQFSSVGRDDLLGVWLRDRKGADPTEWPSYLQVQEFPLGRINATDRV